MTKRYRIIRHRQFNEVTSQTRTHYTIQERSDLWWRRLLRIEWQTIQTHEEWGSVDETFMTFESAYAEFKRLEEDEGWSEEITEVVGGGQC